MFGKQEKVCWENRVDGAQRMSDVLPDNGSRSGRHSTNAARILHGRGASEIFSKNLMARSFADAHLVCKFLNVK
jgi:hypothetical protein